MRKIFFRCALAAVRISGFLMSTALAVLAWGCAREQRTPPHLVLISADALRSDHLSLSGYPRQTSPNIDRFAKSAWRFQQAVTPLPKTGPSVATMFTSLHPHELGVEANRYVVPEDVPLLAELLQREGYSTAAFVSNPALSERLGYSRGFETYGVVDSVRAVNEAFLEWSKTSWTRPTFLWLHYIDPHGPYRPPESFANLFRDDSVAQTDARRVRLDYQPIPGFPSAFVLGAVPDYQRVDDENRVAYYVSQYDAEVRFVDSAFGEVVDALRSTGVFDRSVVVFTADHGESLGEHDYYFEHGWFAQEGTLRVPLLIRTPGQTESVTITSQVSHLDLEPTLLALAGARVPPSARGSNILTRGIEERPLLIANALSYPVRTFGIRYAGWKYLCQLAAREDDGSPCAKEELYDLRRDPFGVDDLSKQDASDLGRLRVMFQAMRPTVERPRDRVPHASGKEPSAVLDKLRSLGYVE